MSNKLTVKDELEKWILSVLKEKRVSFVNEGGKTTTSRTTQAAFAELLATRLSERFVSVRRCQICDGVMLRAKHKYCSAHCQAAAVKRRANN